MRTTCGAFRIAALVIGASPAAHAQSPDLVRWFDVFRPGLVKIETSGGPDQPCRSEGSGFVIGRDATRVLILTAAHVIPNAPECRDAMVVEGRPALRPSDTVELQVLMRSADDIAVLGAEINAFRGALPDLRQVCTPVFGTPIVPISALIYMGYFPGDQMPLPYDGLIETSVEQEPTRQRMRASVNKVVSGSPVIDLTGRVVGMVRERIEEDDYGNVVVNKAYMTPVTVLSSELASIARQSVSGWSCSEEARPVSPVAEPSVIVPIQLAEMNDAHRNASFAEMLAWAQAAAAGKDPPPLRYERRYERRFDPQPGYRFRRIVDARVLSHSRPDEPLPTTTCATPQDCIRIEQDGRQLVVNFRLWSGPSVDRTRGWIDMIIRSEQVRIDETPNR